METILIYHQEIVPVIYPIGNHDNHFHFKGIRLDTVIDQF